MQLKYVPVPTVIVTDGDLCAQKTVAQACHDLQLYYLRITGGNPSVLRGREVIDLIVQAPQQPVVVLVDDKGFKGIGPGESIIQHLLNCPEKIKILGVIAVASNTRVKGIKVDYSVTSSGKILSKHAVDKNGKPEHKSKLMGDTVEILDLYPELLVIGCGDIGKKNGYSLDMAEDVGILKKCFRIILERSEMFFV